MPHDVDKEMNSLKARVEKLETKVEHLDKHYASLWRMLKRFNWSFRMRPFW